MHKGISIQTDLVILDEAHYLSDPDRGVVWEEVLIYLPQRVRLLLLSATISNAHQICSWLSRIRGTPNRIVHSDERPVPLETLFLFPDGLISPLGGKRGLNPKVKKFLASRSGRRGRRSRKTDFGNIIKCLREFDLLPAIFFLTSRKDCDRALLSCSPVAPPPDEKMRLQETVNTFLKNYPHLKGHRQMEPLLECLASSHHGGQLPYWKVLIEKMMSRGHLEAIFSTSTVAAGVNFPARTVVLVHSDRFNGHEFADLTATELHQMIGRAGRRGKDHIGFALVIPGIHQDPRLIRELEASTADPVRSQIKINFSMTLNLLLSHTPHEVKDLLEHSFAAFQELIQYPKSHGIHKDGMREGLWSSFKQHMRFLKETGFMDETDRLTPDGLWASKLRLDQPLLIAEVIRKGAFEDLSPETLAGGLAPFVWDRTLEVELKIKGLFNVTDIEKVFNRTVEYVEEIRRLKIKRGFDTPQIMFWPAAVLFLWAKGVPWQQILGLVSVDEGDIASLIMRTADHLRQITNLRETHAHLVSMAENAIELIQREPVYIKSWP
ncbi:MAG: ATP-dependent DNA helicase [Desulfobacterales bacterium]|nr:ATP-dependent DNA helicase [Desulfobacterales bacterium]